MEYFTFIDNSEYNHSSILFVAEIQTIMGKEHLLKTFSKELNFPDYFGFNWDALSDYLTDLEWIEQKDIILIHNSLPKLNSYDLKIYLGLLAETIIYWNTSDVHNFEIVFPTKTQNKIEELK